jgi:hypothetical protein
MAKNKAVRYLPRFKCKTVQNIEICTLNCGKFIFCLKEYNNYFADVLFFFCVDVCLFLILFVGCKNEKLLIIKVNETRIIYDDIKQFWLPDFKLFEIM